MQENKNQKKKVMILVLVLGLVLLTIGGTYAFFTYSKQGVEEHVLTTGSLYFVYDELANEEDSNKISIGNAFPVTDENGMVQEKPGMFEFEVRAKTQGADINYEIYLTKDDISTLQENVVDTYLTTIEQKDGDVASEKTLDIPWKNVWTKENKVTLYQDLWNSHVPVLETEGKKGKSLYQETIKDTEGQEYSKIFRYRMWLDESANKVNGKGEWLYGGKTFSVHVNVYASNEELPDPTPNAIMKSWFYDWDNFDYETDAPYPNEDFHTQDLAPLIVSVKFENKKVTLEDLTEVDDNHKWDISNGEGSPVIAYLENDGNVKVCPEVGSWCSEQDKVEQQGYRLIIASDGEIYGNPDSSHLFDSFYNLTTINFGNYNTSMVTDMSAMFSECNQLQSLDLNRWDTSNATDMSHLFYGCSQLSDLSSISNWDTSSVTGMYGMFSGCSQLSSVGDLSGWDTSSVENMSYMFHGCGQLNSLDLSGWDTSSVTTMSWMFYNCSQLTELDLSGWDTSEVANMRYMFSQCSQLSDLSSISNWNTSNVTDMFVMFSRCSQLTTLDLSGWDTSSVTSMQNMFGSCSQLTSVGDLSGWDTSSVENMSYMFHGCGQLNSLDLSGWDVSSVGDMMDMFSDCSQLTTLDLSGWDTSNVTAKSSMFEKCSQSINIYVKDEPTKQWFINNASGMRLSNPEQVVKVKTQ